MIAVGIQIGLFIIIMSYLGPKFARDQRETVENNFGRVIARFYLPRNDVYLSSANEQSEIGNICNSN